MHKEFEEAVLALLVLIPAASALVLGLLILGAVKHLSERVTAAFGSLTAVLCWVLTLVLATAVHMSGDQPVDAHYGAWFHGAGYAFELRLLADKLSLAMLFV